MKDETRIIDLTVKEFREILRSEAPKVEEVQEKNIVYGIRGIADIFNCSISTAQRIKNSGKIKKAITQVGRKIIIDVDKVLELNNK
jgi:DNA invertase Pin-like site-specific DNA recombinase